MPPLANRRPYVLPFFLISMGLGFTSWYGLALYELPEYSPAEIEASVEANLAIDLARMGSHLRPDAAKLPALRTQIRAELEAEISREREELQQGLTMGLVCLVLALGHFVFTRLMKTGN